MDALRSLAGVGVILGWAAIIVLLGVFTTIAACILVPDKRPADIADDGQVLDEPLTAPGLNHPAYRALAKRKTWADEQGDHYTTAPVDEAMPPCTCPPGWHTGTAPVSTRLADRRANRVADAGLFAFLADDMPDNHKVADMFDLYCAEAEDRS